jgi:phosphatidate phosphatase PAH1
MKIFKVNKEKEVKIIVNGHEVEGVRMRIGTQGQAYFIEKVKVGKR